MTIFDELASKARRMSDPVLVSIEMFGLVAALAVLAVVPGRPAVGLPFIAMAMFGLWGVSEHFRRRGYAFRSEAVSAIIGLFQLVTALAGYSALAALLFGIVGMLIGTVVS